LDQDHSIKKDMSQRSVSQFKALYGSTGTTFPDNTTQEISEADMRQFGEDIPDSYYNKTDDAHTLIPQFTASGTDTYTATPSPAISAYAAGQTFKILFTNANTGAATINLNGVGAAAITKDGTTALVADDIKAGSIKILSYDGTRFQIIGDGGGTGSGTVESVTGDGVDNTDPKNPVVSGTTREFGRTYTSTLLFDKNMIEGELHVQTDDITFEVSEIGNLVNQESIYGQRIQTDGVHPIYFSQFNHLANMASGDILEAGTYQFIFWYSNGIVRGSVMLPREETAMLTPLPVPANFAAVPGTDPEAELDLSWDAVANADSYEIYRSTAGGAGPWGSAIATPGSGDTTYTDTGRSSNTTYHYRIRAISGGTPFANSGYAITAATTQDAGDVTDPVFTFFPVDAATDVVVNEAVQITASEPIRGDGATEITSANIGDYVTASGSVTGAISITGTIDITKTQIKVIAVGGAWPENEDITITISGVEDLNGNEPASDAITFTTSDFTEMQGNNLSFGTVVDSIISGTDNNFEIEFEFKDILLSGISPMTGKYVSAGLQVSHLWRTSDDTVLFKYYQRVNAISFRTREIAWADALDGVTSGKLTLKYFGALDTNNGLDRAELYLDDVLITTGKSIVEATTDGVNWPWDISGGTAPFKFFGNTFRKVRNFQLRTAMGATTVIDVPIIRTGLDVSGNNFHGIWT
jgi:hypothetical protein